MITEFDSSYYVTADIEELRATTPASPSTPLYPHSFAKALRQGGGPRPNAWTRALQHVLDCRAPVQPRARS